MKARDAYRSQLNNKEKEEMKMLLNSLTTTPRAEKIPAPQMQSATRAKLLAAHNEFQLALVETRLGWMGVAFNAQGLVGLHLPRASRADTLRGLQEEYPNARIAGAAPREISRELKEYADGKRRAFEVPLNLVAVKPFQRAVLEVIQKIPFGQVRTYAWVAREIGKPRAVRAVGHALGANPIPLILPCHRVIGSDGGLHGYGGGLELKARLLRLEGAMI